MLQKKKLLFVRCPHMTNFDIFLSETKFASFAEVAVSAVNSVVVHSVKSSNHPPSQRNHFNENRGSILIRNRMLPLFRAMTSIDRCNQRFFLK